MENTTTSGGSGDRSAPDAVLKAARAAREAGWRIIPLHRVGPDGLTCSCRDGRNCNSAGKHPKHKDWQDTPEMSRADVEATWGGPQPPNLGAATGAPSGWWALDVDPEHGGFESARKLAETQGSMPTTRVVKTGSGGYHYIFAMPDFDVTNSNRWFRENGYPGIDVRGTGGQVVLPPSRSRKGAYEVVVDAEPAQAPGWLLDAVRPAEPVAPVEVAQSAEKVVPDDPAEADRLEHYTQSAVKREVEQLRTCKRLATPTGQGYVGPPWNTTVFESSCALIQLANSSWSTIDVGEAYRVIFEAAPRDAGFDDEVVNRTFASAHSKVGEKARPAPQRPEVHAGDPLTDPQAGAKGDAPSQGRGGVGPTSAPVGSTQDSTDWPMRSWDDLGNAMRMVDHYGKRLRWIEQAGTWAVYRDGRWAMDTGRWGQNLAQTMIEALPETEALGYDEECGPDEKESPREKFVKWVKAQRMSGKISSCLKETQGRAVMQAAITDFDLDPMLLNVANGVVDLTNGRLRPHDPALLLMQQSPVAYDPAAQAPRWEAFLHEVMPNPDMRAYLQRVCGYSLTGKTGEQAMFLHHGSGANGKSVFLQVATHVSGDYGQVVPRTTLLVQNNEEHPTSIARMVGKRFLQTSETAAGRRLDEEVVKGLTGGEKQTARYMNKDFFDFTPTGKIHYVTNHLPRLTDAESIWRRLHLVGWRVTVPEAQRDPELAAKIIREEAPGVLAWMVSGAVAWHGEGGLRRPQLSQLDLRDYREDQDEFGDFIRECLVVTADENDRTSISDVYGAYTAWAWRSGWKAPMRKPDLVRVLRERGMPGEYRTDRERGFSGVLVRSLDERPAAPKGVSPVSTDPLARLEEGLS